MQVYGGLGVKGEALGKIPKYLEASLKISAAGAGTQVAPLDCSA